MFIHKLPLSSYRLNALFTTLIGWLTFSGHSLASEVEHHHFYSSTLGYDYPYSVYLPDNYDAQATAAYPVVYMLHGSFGTDRDWVARGNLQQVADRLIRAGHIPRAVFIMPGSRSWWVDGHNEPARSAFFNDLMPHIEATYRVGQERRLRGIAGLSAGGYGALNFALERPELFAAVAALSPASYVPLPPRNSSAWRHPAFRNDQGQFDQTLWETLNYTAHLEEYRLKVTPAVSKMRATFPRTTVYQRRAQRCLRRRIPRPLTAPSHGAHSTQRRAARPLPRRPHLASLARQPAGSAQFSLPVRGADR